MIYAIGMRSRRAAPMPPGDRARAGCRRMLVADLPDAGLARVAEETGGGYIEIRYGQDLGAAFAGVADELHTQYLLAFTPPRRDGKVHEVSVRVTPGGLKTRAKKTYVAPKISRGQHGRYQGRVPRMTATDYTDDTDGHRHLPPALWHFATLALVLAP